MLQQNCFGLLCANFKKLFGDMLLGAIWVDATARAVLNLQSNGCYHKCCGNITILPVLNIKAAF
jgi:hypothetical protein